MSRIRGRNTSPELRLRRALWSAGMRYRVDYPVLRISPDIAFPGRRLLVFIDGCFWHGCPLHYVLPRSRSDFWLAKLRANVERDRNQTALLEEHGWQVVRVWEHETFTDLDACVVRIQRALSGGVDEGPTSRVLHARPLSDDLEEWTMIDLRGPVEHRITRRRTTTKWKRGSDAR